MGVQLEGEVHPIFVIIVFGRDPQVMTNRLKCFMILKQDFEKLTPKVGI